MGPLVLKLEYVFYFSEEEIQNMVATMEAFIPSVPKLVCGTAVDNAVTLSFQGSWRSRRSGFRELQRSGDRKKIAPQTLWSQPRCFLSCLGSLWLRGTVHLLLCADSLRLCCWDCITCNPSSQGTLTAKRRQESEKSRPREPLPFASCFGSTVLPGFRAVPVCRETPSLHFSLLTLGLFQPLITCALPPHRYKQSSCLPTHAG